MQHGKNVVKPVWIFVARRREPVGPCRRSSLHHVPCRYLCGSRTGPSHPTVVAVTAAPPHYKHTHTHQNTRFKVLGVQSIYTTLYHIWAQSFGNKIRHWSKLPVSLRADRWLRVGLHRHLIRVDATRSIRRRQPGSDMTYTSATNLSQMTGDARVRQQDKLDTHILYTVIPNVFQFCVLICFIFQLHTCYLLFCFFCFQLSVPVQMSVWKDSSPSPKWPVMCRVGRKTVSTQLHFWWESQWEIFVAM